MLRIPLWLLVLWPSWSTSFAMTCMDIDHFMKLSAIYQSKGRSNTRLLFSLRIMKFEAKVNVTSPSPHVYIKTHSFHLNLTHNGCFIYLASMELLVASWDLAEDFRITMCWRRDARSMCRRSHRFGEFEEDDSKVLTSD